MSFLKIFRADLPEVNTENKMLILASKSPRRKELMELLGVPFEIHQKDIDETPVHPLSPEETVRFLSAKKAEAVAVEHPFDLVLGVDTLVFAQGQILGRPKECFDSFQDALTPFFRASPFSERAKPTAKVFPPRCSSLL